MSSRFRPLRAEPPANPSPRTNDNQQKEEEEDDDDYMTMAIAEPAQPIKETSIQRTQRLKKEALARGRPKSKAELAAAEAAARDTALSTSLFDAPGAHKNKGFAMMAKMGFSGGGLGKTDGSGAAPGRAEPIRISIKSDRGGIGLDAEKKRKMRAAVGNDDNDNNDDAEMHRNKKEKLDPLEYRDRVAREREAERRERQLLAAQRMALQMHEETAEASAGTETNSEAGDIRSVNVLWRGLLAARRKAERQRLLKRELEESLSAMHGERNGLDDDDRMALGKDVSRLLPLDGEEDEGEGDGEGDEELGAFEALEPVERLRRVLEHLRGTHRYCFWCKTAFPDEQMDGCPGVTEEDHD